ncbi:L,D-transpeptidase family protein [Atopobacter phocae]|uniref:L,D-transpeptidase family protein n=1 Tax=Atopobacter phocae TaxID=136492 RepID=UPI0004AD9539|nr:L,D-transpeptidase family protein [Atopobacter phocae]
MTRKKMWYIAGSSLAVVLGIYFIGAIYFIQHFNPGTSFKTHTIEYQTVDKAAQTVGKSWLSEEYYVVEDGKKLATYTAKELGVNIDVNKTLNEMLKRQNAFSWPITLLQGKLISAESLSADELDVNEKQLDEFVNQLNINNSTRHASKDATIKINEEKGLFDVEPEVEGNIVEMDSLKEQIVQRLLDDSRTVNLKDVYEKPKVTVEDKRINDDVKKMNEQLDLKITIEYQNSKVDIPREELAKLLTIDDQLNITVNSEAASAFSSKFSREVGTYFKTREFKSTNRGIINVPPGTYGWSVDVEKLSKDLTDIIKKGKDGTIKAALQGSGITRPDDIGNTYVEVSLADQMLWVYKEGQIALQAPIVSGHPKTPTYPGVWYVWTKQRNAVLKGINGRSGQSYAAPVSYWMPFNWDGYGMHDSPWQPAYGGASYLTAGSNGCVNVEPSTMATLYNLVGVDTPVIIY